MNDPLDSGRDIDAIRLLRDREVAVLLAVDRRSVWRMVAMGELPPPVRIGRRMARWRLIDLQEFIDSLPRKGCR